MGKRWDETNQRWKGREPGILNYVLSSVLSVGRFFSGDKEPMEPEEPKTSHAAETLSKKLIIEHNKQNGFIYVTLTWNNPVVGADLVNGFIEHANRFIARREQERSRKALVASLNYGKK